MNEKLRQTMSMLRSDLTASGHRQLVVLSGERKWCISQLMHCLDAGVDLWLGADPESVEVRRHAPQQTACQHLGSEVDSLVFDAHDGLDPDAFGAACGLVKGGGLMFLLTPELALWPLAPDLQKKKLVVHPLSEEAAGKRYISRFAGLIQSSQDVQLIRQGAPLKIVAVPLQINPGSARKDWPVSGQTPDQREAVRAVSRLVHGHRHRPLVLVADRGRGKSAALGFAVRELGKEAPRVIGLTAPRKLAVEAVYKHAGDHRSWIQYFPPDELIQQKPSLDILLVDEAAAIPTQLLSRMLKQYSRVVFSTTEHGYEGSGRGFSVRFRKILDRETPGWKEIRLLTPVRWAENDTLERFCFQALMLDAVPAEIDEQEISRLDKLELCWLDRDKLADEETLLRQIFGLLVLAHYETRPMDLRHMLDAANLSLAVLRLDGRVVATTLVAREGGLDAGLARQVARGERRPQGHLLAQSMVSASADCDAMTMQCDRVVRIAVVPELQNLGIGGRILKAVEQKSAREGLDYIGASLGLNQDILPFWSRAGYHSSRLGTKQNHASGEHSLLMSKGLSDRGKLLVNDAHCRFSQQLPLALSDTFAGMVPETAVALLARCQRFCSELTDIDSIVLHDFAYHDRTYEDSLLSIWRLIGTNAQSRVMRENAIPAQLMIAKILQKKTWKETADYFGLSGRRQVMTHLRQAVACLLENPEERQ